ncbi:adenine phosphoribosyltransferase [Brumicola nitratireducens]|uniref:Adenine phosphoribosyltransferase n=1 Tax=Glaciecola nitratireducens (strain JCM 12485 / KCTC 12276 / FR1064) TaxID=1085623 RepID=G4QK69_GLANF|nr:adenine phosphoribosyltransferase [Glaciecola nitratireducens]AEP29268.1 adenine phosphoribosyltransferase [Glaciecola nitratireducens FR1064]
MTIELIKSAITSIPDYPKKGIMFRDVTSVLQNHEAFTACIEQLKAQFNGMTFDKVVGTEARGFLFGAPLALEMGIGFVPARKPGKLPREVISETYELEYGIDALEIHKDAILPGERVLMIDDLLATGGTMVATANLIRQLGGIAEHAGFVISLPEIGGAKKLEEHGVTPFSLIEFEGE